jgi:hypothetical protein
MKNIEFMAFISDLITPYSYTTVAQFEVPPVLHQFGLINQG